MMLIVLKGWLNGKDYALNLSNVLNQTLHTNVSPLHRGDWYFYFVFTVNIACATYVSV